MHAPRQGTGAGRGDTPRVADRRVDRARQQAQLTRHALCVVGAGQLPARADLAERADPTRAVGAEIAFGAGPVRDAGACWAARGWGLRPQLSEVLRGVP